MDFILGVYEPKLQAALSLKFFLEAIVSGDEATMNRLAPQVTAVMTDFLKARYRADEQDANDCAQNTMLSLMENIREEKVVPDNPGAYIRTSLKNYYFRMYNKNKTSAGDEPLAFQESEHDPASMFQNSEMIQLLRMCIEKLDEFQRRLIRYWLKHPDIRANEVATRFEISINNVWVRRHRIHKQLHDCIQKNI